MIKFHIAMQNFGEPTKELDAAMRAHRIAHDGNPVLEWCIGNVVGRYDARANVYPRQGPTGAEDRSGRGAHHGDRPLHGREAGALGLREPRRNLRRVKSIPRMTGLFGGGDCRGGNQSWVTQLP